MCVKFKVSLALAERRTGVEGAINSVAVVEVCEPRFLSPPSPGLATDSRTTCEEMCEYTENIVVYL